MQPDVQIYLKRFFGKKFDLNSSHESLADTF